MILLVTVEHKEVFELEGCREIIGKFNHLELMPTAIILKTRAKDEKVTAGNVRDLLVDTINLAGLSESKIFVIELPSYNRAAWHNFSDFKREQIIGITQER